MHHVQKSRRGFELFVVLILTSVIGAPVSAGTASTAPGSAESALSLESARSASKPASPPAVSAPAPTGARPSLRPLGQDELMTLAPYVVQLVNLAIFDPKLAANAVPDAWIDFILKGAMDVEAESAARPAKTSSPASWPIGPWTTPATLAHTIKALDPTAVAALYRALSPRMTRRCRELGSSTKACGRALRSAVSTLSAPEVLRYSAGEAETSPMTATQVELARLGVPVVTAVRDQLQILGSVLWGKPRGSVRQ